MMSAPAGLYRARLGGNLLGRQAALHQIDRGNAEDHQEIATGPLTHGDHDLAREPQPVIQAAAPGVVAVVGAGRGELVDEVALAPHDLDAVVAGLPRQSSRRSIVGDGAQDVRLGHAPRCIGIDGRGNRGWPHRALDFRVAPRMQDLQGDLAAGRMHGVRDRPVLGNMLNSVEDGCSRLHQPFIVGREAARDDEPGAAPGPLDVEARDAFDRPIERLQPRVHGAHDDAVGEADEAEVERLEQVRIGGHSGPSGAMGRRPHSKHIAPAMSPGAVTPLRARAQSPGP